MIKSVQMVPVDEVEEGMVLDLYDDEYSQDFESIIDTEQPFEVVEVDFEDEEIVFLDQDGVQLHFPYFHTVRVITGD